MPSTFLSEPAASPAAVIAPHRSGTASRVARVPSIDMLRGLVMALMVVDHARDFFGASGFNPRDVHDAALFLTRWITHLCAPVFVFLAGTSAGLRQQALDNRRAVSGYLITRGLWLIALELTIVRIVWSFDVHSNVHYAQVIWALGVSMIALAALIYLPRALLLAVPVAMIAGHNVLDRIRIEGTGIDAALWTLLHQPGEFIAGGATIVVLYPLIPWIGVMAAGYVFTSVLELPDARRRRLFVALGGAMLAAFALLRGLNIYGNPAPWQRHEHLLATALSFIDCEKYPPSLLFLLVTLGLALPLLAVLDRTNGAVRRTLATIGRAPLFFYVGHIYLLHAAAVIAGSSIGRDTAWLFDATGSKPADWGWPLPVVYAVAAVTTAALYPLTRWFGALKQRREWWWSYV
jgi:uncharacterized membrane protein